MDSFSRHNIEVSGSSDSDFRDRFSGALDWCSKEDACRGNLGISRDRMPQVSEENTMDYLRWLSAQGIKSTKGNLPVGRLRATQKEINADKVAKLAKLDPRKLNHPVLISKDGYLLDGHHRWAALVSQDPKTKMQVIKIDAPIRELFPLTHKYPKVSRADFSGNRVARLRIASALKRSMRGLESQIQKISEVVGVSERRVWKQLEAAIRQRID